jgi:hypothetical protein
MSALLMLAIAKFKEARSLTSYGNLKEENMIQGEGCWIVVLQLPRLENRIMGRYRIRSDAEWHAHKLKRLLGDRYPIQVLFDQENDLNDTSIPSPGAQAPAWAPPSGISRFQR